MDTCSGHHVMNVNSPRSMWVTKCILYLSILKLIPKQLRIYYLVNLYYYKCNIDSVKFYSYFYESCGIFVAILII